MKKALTIIFLFCSTLSFSQELRADTIIIKGKQYLLYPYQFDCTKFLGEYGKKGQSGYRSATYLCHDEIPPVLDSLPSGEYLMLFSPYYLMPKRQKKILKKNNYIGARFHIANGTLNGSAIVYYPSGEIKKRGAYKNGVKEGIWKEYGSYRRELKEFTFVNGVQEGWYREYDIAADSTLILRKEYFKKGLGFTHHFKSFHKNGALQIEAYSDTLVKLYDNAVRRDRYYSDIHDSSFSRAEKFTTEGEKGKQWFNKKFRKKHLMKQRMIWEHYHPADYAQAPLNLPFKVYHDNGLFFGELKCYQETKDYYGPPKCIALSDTLMGYSNKPAVIRKTLSDSLDQHRYELRYIDRKDWLKYNLIYVEDSAGIYQLYKEIQFYSQQNPSINLLDYSFFYKAGSLNTKDSLVLISSEKNFRGKTKQTYISPFIPGKIFTVDENLCPGKSKLSLFITNYSKQYSYHYAKVYENLKVLSYYSKKETDESFLGAILFHDVYGGHWSDNQQFLLGAGWKELDSIKILYDGKPYTGELTVMYNTNIKSEGLLQKTKNSIIVEYHNPSWFTNKDKQKKPIKKLCLQVKEGSAVNIKLFGENYSYLGNEIREIDLKNNKVSGLDQAYVENKKMLFFKTKNHIYTASYLNNRKDGLYKHWINEYNDSKWTLLEKSHYKNNHLIDTTFTYSDDGTISSILPYDNEGNLNGTSTFFWPDGKISSLTEYKNGVYHGNTIEFNEQGDTTLYLHYIDGKANGPLFKKRESEAIHNPGFVLRAEFNNDTLVGRLTYQDAYNVKRLEIKIDSALEGSSPYLSDYFYEYWKNREIAGDVSLYHANGTLYANGKTKIISRTPKNEKTYYTMKKDGIWKYYNSVGKLITEINYYHDSTRYMGDYKEFYPEGGLKYEGKLIREYEDRDCATDLKELAFFVDYKTYISAKGDTLLKNGNGTIKMYTSSGILVEEGVFENSLKQGWWKQYNKEGKLITVGQYKNGAKHGRWLQGDLTGINYLDNKCFESEEIKKAEQEKQKFKIFISETIYENGNMVSTQQYSVDRKK